MFFVCLLIGNFDLIFWHTCVWEPLKCGAPVRLNIGYVRAYILNPAMLLKLVYWQWLESPCFSMACMGLGSDMRFHYKHDTLSIIKHVG